MASADLKEELECSICLSIYTDPITLICGHNFCQDCIGRVLDSQERSGGYFCPDCREEFQERPSLRRNITLRNIVENFRPTRPDQVSSGVFCTYCIHTPVPAVKSCLLCEASLCDDHLRVHIKSPEHVLCDPTTSLENRKCSSSEHVLRGPTTSLENRKWSSSEHVLRDPTTSQENRKWSSSQHVLRGPTTSLENRKWSSSEYVLRDPTTSLENRKCSSSEYVLRDPTTSLENRKCSSSEYVLRDPTTSLENRKWSSSQHVLRGPTTSLENRQWTSSEHVLHDPTTSLENRKWSSSQHVLRGPTTSLENRQWSSSEHVLRDPTTSLENRKWSSSEHVLRDPTTFLENRKCSSSEYVLRDPTTSLENRKWSSSERFLCGPTTSLENRKFSVQKNTLHTGLSDTMSGVNAQKCADTHVYPHSSAKEMLPFIAKPSKKHPEHTPTIQHSHPQAGEPKIGAVQKTWGASRFADIILDMSTASNYLAISDDRKTVYRSPRKVFPEIPESFRCSQVMSIQSFSSGRHYWEVEVGDSPIWKVGMCYPSMDRRGFQSGLGYNDKSWCLERRKYNQCFFLHDSNQIPLPGGIYSNGLRVELDYEAGQISFYDLCYPIRHLHTFTATFTEPLHVGLRIGKDSYMVLSGREHEVRNLHRDW
ncbi:uncharacterized protein [Aquarana catesbeiana]|uniref:uncharacterized protein n=1 Tax=Aquarana catesbeiana TaxID=8400 RepID=UPI003CC92D17